MSFTASCTVVERGSQASKKISGKSVDPRAPMRLLFPGGWENKDSDVFRWYNSQPHKFFQKIQYYKERQGVGHEFIVLPLKNSDGAPNADWFCRLERMADQEHQLGAIATNGTDAFDYIHASESDPLRPRYEYNLATCPSEEQMHRPSPEKIAEIDLSHDFDLMDVLAICSAIHEHPKARRYTLQQYNCYFFCWAILLLLSRRSANWENVVQRQMVKVRTSILQAVATPVPAEKAKLAHILASAYSSNPDPTQSLLYNALASELSSIEFSQFIHLALRSLLWVQSGSTALKHDLEEQFQALAEQTLDLLTGGLDVDPDAKIANSLRDATRTEHGVDMEELLSEGAVFFRRIYLGIEAKILEEEIQSWKRSHENSQIQPGSARVIKRRAFKLAAERLKYYLMGAALLLPSGLIHAFHTAKIQDDAAARQGLNKVTRALKCVGNTFRHLPHSLCCTPKLLSLVGRAVIIESEEEGAFRFYKSACELRALELTAVKFYQRLRNQGGRLISSLVFQFIILGSQKWGLVLLGTSPKKFWSRILWDFLGDLIAGAILSIVLAEQMTELRFVCSQPRKDKIPLTEGPGFQLTPIAQLQQFIKERIVQLSRHDIESAPFFKHVPMPAMAPPRKSQVQMEDALEHIWRTANEGNRFRGMRYAWLAMS
ncbi:hypothetical protein BDV93DRAFT_565238 [Ceratobasidium sp. AG-I]|nr:hypothetical protein BDV93DRAFT_565238 [Ceratobasidium sp. AG-I]